MKSLSLEAGIKCLGWNENESDVVLILSKDGKLIVGSFTSELKPVAQEVGAGRILHQWFGLHLIYGLYWFLYNVLSHCRI